MRHTPQLKKPLQKILHAIPICFFSFLLVASAQAASVPRYNHIFLIILENHGYLQIIGNPAAPNINALADTYGSATSYFGVSSPSEPNYVAMLGGNFFGIADDNAYYGADAVNKPSLMSQMEAAHLHWKGYFQGMPYAGFRGICYPVRCGLVPDVDELYASKHNGIANFVSIQASNTEFAKMVPLPQLSNDLANGLPNFVYIVPDLCHDMHGAPPFCNDSGNPGDNLDNHLVSQGDAFVGQVVDQITDSSFWSSGNNAIVVTFDEGADGDTTGCCDANPGSGQVVAIVITSHGPRGLKDNTPYNHYSLLQTFQKAFGLGCLEFTCDTANVTPMAPLFATH